jgi:RNA polymerase sigma factor (sigma-70 family)
VVNLANSHFRRRRVERAYLTRVQRDAAVRSGNAPVDPSVEDRERLWDALGSLPHRQRAAIVLRYYEDLSEARIAELLQCRPGTVKSLLSRGLGTMRTEIGGDER